MKQRVEVGKAGAVRGQIGQILVLAGDLVVNVLENDDQHTVKVAGAGSRRSALCFFLLPFRRLRHFGLRRLARRGGGNTLRSGGGIGEYKSDRHEGADTQLSPQALAHVRKTRSEE